MSTEENSTPDDLLSRRLSSGPEPASDGAEETARGGAHSADGHTKSFGDSSHLEDTAPFDPIAHDPDASSSWGASHGSEHSDDPATRELSTGTAGASASAGKPEMFTDEEWALVNGGSAGGAGTAGAGGAAAGAAGAAAGKKQSRAERKAAKRAAKLDDDRRGDAKVLADDRPKRSPLDVIGLIWFAIGTPFVVFALAIRAIASGLFLRFEYFWRPGFPADDYGFSSEDRLHYGSYAVDYLYNQDTERYLSDVVLPDGTPLLTSGEITHMADVKGLITLLTLIAIVAAIGMVLFGLVLSRRTGPGIRSGVRAGTILTLCLMIVLGLLAAFGWEQFFTGFHQLFFAEGTWTFYMDDSLIRLFPPQFWVDAGIGVAAIAVALSVFAFVLSFIGAKAAKQRRADALAARAEA